MFRLSSLRTRLLLLVFLAVLPAVGLLLYTAEGQRRVQAAQVRDDALHYAQIAAAAEQQLIDDTRHLLIAIAQLDEVHGGDPSPCNAVLTRLLKQYPMLTDLQVLDANGQLFAAALPQSSGLNYGDRAWFKQALETRSFTISGYLIGRSTGAAIVAAAFPATDEDGRVHRLVATSLDLARVRESASLSELPDVAVVTVTDGRGTIVSRQPDNEQWVGRPAPAWRTAAMAASPNGEGTAEGPGVDGVTRLYGFSRLKDADLSVSVGISRSLAYAEVNQALVRSLLLLAAATVLTSGVAWAAGQAILIRPVSRLVEAARQLATGDLSARVEPAGGHGELHDLAEAFDRMAGSLQEQQARLARLNRLYSVLSKTDEAIVRIREPQKLYEETCRIAVEEGSFRMAWVGLVDTESSWVEPVAWAGAVAGYLDNVRVSVDEGVPEGRGPTGMALRQGRMVASNDMRSDERMKPWRDEAVKRGYRSFAALPLSTNGQVFGALMLHSSEPGFFENEEEVGLLETLAADLSFAAESAEQERERKRVETALRESEERFRTYMDNSPTFVFMNDAGGRILYLNSRMERFYGMAPGSWRGRSTLDYQPAERGEQMVADDRRVLDTGEPLESLERLQAADGSWHEWLTFKFPLQDMAGRTYVGGISVDATEQRRADIALRHYAERLKTLHQIDQAILAARSPEQIAQAALECIAQLVPCQRASLVAFDFGAQQARLVTVVADRPGRFEPDAHLPLSLYDVDVLRTGRTIEYDDFAALVEPPPFVRKLQQEGLRSYLLIPLKSAEELIGYLGLGSETPGAFQSQDEEIAREVADQLAVAYQQARLHEQVRRYASDLEASVAERTQELQEINAELKSFAYSISHDLHAPLRAMQGFAQALVEDYAGSLDELGQEYARRIVAASERMDHLINDLLAYSRVSRAELTLKPVDLSSVVSESLAQLAGDLKACGAQVTVEEPLAQVVGHQGTLVQVVANLVSNAVKFVAPGVQPRVRLWVEDISPAPLGDSPALLGDSPAPLDQDGWRRLWLEDNGIGIAPEHQERVFRIFERLHGLETYPGTGIGLAIVRRAMERMGGRVGVESSVGQGSRFWVDLRRPRRTE
jgi:PAS domain S-box-containing protein